MNGWRGLTSNMIQKEFPDTTFKFIDAGIPSFDSIENAFRFKSDVLEKGEIDLLFIEAAVNDETNGRTEEEIIKSFEGAINQAYKSNPNMDIEANTPGASFAFNFKGIAIGTLDVASPDVGIIEYSVDGTPYKKFDLFTEWSRGLHLPWAHMLEINLEDTDHTVTIRTINEKNPLSRGNACRIRNILVNTD